MKTEDKTAKTPKELLQLETISEHLAKLRRSRMRNIEKMIEESDDIEIVRYGEDVLKG